MELRVPKLPHYTRYHRILRNAERLVAELALSVLGDNQVHLIDSKPLPVANPKSPPLGKRSSWSKFPEAMNNTMRRLAYLIYLRHLFLSLLVSYTVRDVE